MRHDRAPKPWIGLRTLPVLLCLAGSSVLAVCSAEEHGRGVGQEQGQKQEQEARVEAGSPMLTPDQPRTLTLEPEGDASVGPLTRFAEAGEERLVATLELARVELPAGARARVRLFLDLPEADRSTPIESPRYLGSFTFFPADGSEGQSFAFDLSEVLTRLPADERRALLEEGATVTAVLVPMVEGEDLTGAEVELVEPRLRVLRPE